MIFVLHPILTVLAAKFPFGFLTPIRTQSFFWFRKIAVLFLEWVRIFIYEMAIAAAITSVTASIRDSVIILLLL